MSGYYLNFTFGSLSTFLFFWGLRYAQKERRQQYRHALFAASFAPLLLALLYLTGDIPLVPTSEWVVLWSLIWLLSAIIISLRKRGGTK